MTPPAPAVAAVRVMKKDNELVDLTNKDDLDDDDLLLRVSGGGEPQSTDAIGPNSKEVPLQATSPESNGKRGVPVLSPSSQHQDQTRELAAAAVGQGSSLPPKSASPSPRKSNNGEAPPHVNEEAAYRPDHHQQHQRKDGSSNSDADTTPISFTRAQPLSSCSTIRSSCGGRRRSSGRRVILKPIDSSSQKISNQEEEA
mmetsp:Transcript_6430/g.9521  ORF Transcript_6430/g.9521 Transcript_6430/m.9521 type:complete len:199 (+) Transcript_6430:432-1028(+)